MFFFVFFFFLFCYKFGHFISRCSYLPPKCNTYWTKILLVYRSKRINKKKIKTATYTQACAHIGIRDVEKTEVLKFKEALNNVWCLFIILWDRILWESAPFNILLTFSFVNSISLSWQQNFDNSQTTGFNAMKTIYEWMSKSKCVPQRSFILRKDTRSMIKMIASLKNTPAFPITWLTFFFALRWSFYDTYIWKKIVHNISPHTKLLLR